MFVKIFLSFWLTVGLFAAAQEGAARISRNEELQLRAELHERFAALDLSPTGAG